LEPIWSAAARAAAFGATDGKAVAGATALHTEAHLECGGASRRFWLTDGKAVAGATALHTKPHLECGGASRRFWVTDGKAVAGATALQKNYFVTFTVTVFEYGEVVVALKACTRYTHVFRPGVSLYVVTFEPMAATRVNGPPARARST
jgi:hypothetical protein